MTDTNDALWLSFEALAKTYPDDDGVRMTADLARWLWEEHQRARLAAPPIVEKIVEKIVPVLPKHRRGAHTKPLRLDSRN